MYQQPNYSQDQPNSNVPFWVRIDDFDGETYYSWTQQLAIPGPSFIDAPGGMVGTFAANPAYEVNGALLTVGKYVQIRREYLDPSLNWVYSASYPASANTPPDETTVCVCITDACTGEVRYFNIPESWETTESCASWYCLEAPETLDLSCNYVTPDELATLEGEGYTVISGPHADESTCIASCEGSGSGSGSGSCDFCDTVYCVTFTGITTDTLGHCDIGDAGPSCDIFNTPIELTGACPTWQVTLPFCYGTIGGGSRTATAQLIFTEATDKGTLIINESGNLLAWYENLAWDCSVSSAFKLVSTGSGDICDGWPSSVQVVPGACGGSGSGSGSGSTEGCCPTTDCFCSAMYHTLQFEIVSGCSGATTLQTMTYDAAGAHGAGWYTPEETISGVVLQWFMPCAQPGAPTSVEIDQIHDGSVVIGTGSSLVCDPFDTGNVTIPASMPCDPTTVVKAYPITFPNMTATITDATGCLTGLPGTITLTGDDTGWLGTFTPFACEGGTISSLAISCSGIAWLRGTYSILTPFDSIICGPYAGVWYVDDGLGNICTITATE